MKSVIAILILALCVGIADAKQKEERQPYNFKAKVYLGPSISFADFADLSCRLCSVDVQTPADSYQTFAIDLTLGAASGKSDAGDTAFFAPVMGNLMNAAALTKTQNYLGGGIFHYTVTGSGATTYPNGAVLGGIGDGSTDAKGAFVAYTDGDSETTTARAAYKVMNNNSTAASGFDFGVDLQDAAHDGFAAVDKDFYLKAPVRLVSDVVFIVDVACTSGTTGDNVAGPGSLCFNTADGKLYINTGTITDSTWTVVGTQS